MARKPIKFESNPLLGGPSFDTRTRSGSPYRDLLISDIDVDPDQPRKVFEKESLEELSSSIKVYGVICPILVCITPGGTYRLIAGERRLRAAKMAGLETIPAVIDSKEEAGVKLPKQLVENLQREDLTPMERALAIGQLRDAQKLSIRDIASQLGISKGQVQRSLEILGLPDDLQAALIAGASESKILLLAGVNSRAARKKLLEQLDNLNRHQLKQEIEAAKGTGERAYHGGTKPSKAKIKLSVEDRRIIEEIQRTLGTKVHLVRTDKKGGQGKMTLEFYSSGDLYEIYRRLTV